MSNILVGGAGHAGYHRGAMPTVVDYRMARRALLRDLENGLRSRIDVCDAHPELVRAARHLGEAVEETCPVCEEEPLRLLFYTYGLRGRENGRVRRRSDLDELRARFAEYTCYVVEVCTECQWNHLVRSFTTGHKHAV